MEFEKFKEILDTIRSIDDYVSKLDELGIHIYETPLYDDILVLERRVIEGAYTKEGYDWLEWYLYEMPNFDRKIKLDGDKPEYHAWDENGEPMDLGTDEKLWKLLEHDYGAQ